MNRDEFKEFWNSGIVILDGATGTNLQKAGMPVGVCPEQWILGNRDIMLRLQKDFVQAGSQILYTPTFTGNRLKLADYGLEKELVRMNRELAGISREAAGDRALVAGDMTMTGQQLAPLGTLTFEELVDIYKEQVLALLDAGVDLFVVETMMSLQETRAAVLAVRETCGLPVMASLTFEEDGRTLFGTTPEAAVTVLQSLGADAVGMNCSTGPEGMLANLKKMAPYAAVPVLAKPNAGLPQLVDGKTVYPASPEEFAAAGRQLAEAGARLIGGCCGTTPEHIRQLAEALRGVTPVPVPEVKPPVLASERSVAEIRRDGPLLIIGERINPTGKKKLQEELRAGRLDMVHAMARAQEEAGADLLDINMGTNGIDEKAMMIEAVCEVTQAADLPLCIDTSYPEVMEAALRVYPGRALINSITMESEKFRRMLPLAAKYGAMFIFLPITDEGIPQTQEEKHRVLREALAGTERAGIGRENVIVDALVATVGADPEAAMHCLDTIAYCRDELKTATVIGLSNISFGLPERSFVNEAFLVMAIARGLTMAIANPQQERLQELAAASDMLTAKADGGRRYIRKAQAYADRREAERDIREKVRKSLREDESKKAEAAGQGPDDPAAAGRNDPVFQAVLEGDRRTIVELARQEVEQGRAPEAVINESLIPAINAVGDLFDKKRYYLPQLIASAGAMETAIAYLEPMIKKDSSDVPAETVVIATVEGDVHDIGKNLVGLMLRNYGYRVIDLGKDVPAEKILQAAAAEKAGVIGLSALMTTTMMRMKDVIGEAARLDYRGKIIVGGAAVTESFAEEIGADGYSPDAADCVKLVGRLLRDA